MSRQMKEILEDALSLPLEARAALAGTLIESLDETIDNDAEDSWNEEIRRRLAEIDTGKVQMIPWSEVRSRLERR